MNAPVAISPAVPVTLGRTPRTSACLPPAPGASGAAMPTTGPLVDRYGRVHTDLRLSVTDRCNLRCVYCMPEEGVAFRPRSEILTFEEIARVAAVAKRVGVTAVRLTGGEPLVRKGIVDLVALVASVGFEDLALTTNGTALRKLAAPLAHAGLRRVNVSCDSLHAQRFGEIRRRGELASVLDGMDAAEEAGLAPLKVNVVLVAGVNDDEILDFAHFARATGRVVRFIEYMPLDAEGAWRHDRVVASADVLAAIASRWPLVAVTTATGAASDPAPAERFAFGDGAPGEIGVVASVTRPFCGTCNRLRLTADGAVRNCLFSDDESPIRELLRSGAGDDAIEAALRASVWGKLPGHGINDPGFLRPARSMSMIGG